MAQYRLRSSPTQATLTRPSRRLADRHERGGLADAGDRGRGRRHLVVDAESRCVAATTIILLHTVERDDFELTVTERGEVEAFDVTEVRSLVKSNNTTGNAILRIVPEGTVVKKGDFLVELDSSALDAQRTTPEDSRQRRQGARGRGPQQLRHGRHRQARVSRRHVSAGAADDRERSVRRRGESQPGQGVLHLQPEAGLEGLRERDCSWRPIGSPSKRRTRTSTRPRPSSRCSTSSPSRSMVSTLESAIQIAKAKWDSGQNSHELELEKLADLDDQIAKCTIVAPQDGIVKYAHVMDGRGDQEFIVEEGHGRPRAAGDHHACRTPIRCASI